MRPFQFTKMQGLGNDFVLVEGPFQLSAEDIQTICDRRFGIGADGVLVVTNGDPIRMEYWNADGSHAEMCGNGLRCVARYAFDRGWSHGRNFTVQTPIGVKGVRVLEDGDIEVDLGRPVAGDTLEIGGDTYQMVSMGNPHAVTFVDDPADVDVEAVGAGLQSQFAEGANVEFIKVADDKVHMRVWERGIGETLACGTGIAAVASVVREAQKTDGPIRVSMRGGDASVEFRDGVAWLRGQADYSFRGSVGER